MQPGMDQPLRPDLGRILPVPIVRKLGGAERALGSDLGRALDVPAPARGEDFLVDVQQRRSSAADDTAFGIDQASKVAEKIAAVFADRDRRVATIVHKLDPTHVQKLTSPS
jgi:hypothetical protein